MDTGGQSADLATEREARKRHPLEGEICRLGDLRGAWGSAQLRALFTRPEGSPVPAHVSP